MVSFNFLSQQGGFKGIQGEKRKETHSFCTSKHEKDPRGTTISTDIHKLENTSRSTGRHFMIFLGWRVWIWRDLPRWSRSEL